MNAGALMLCLCVSFATGSPPRDAWFGEDKLMHFAAAFAATTLSASAARATGLEAGSSAVVGAAVGGGFSIWKEIHDHRRPDGFFSYRDLVWDAGGIATATLVMRQVR
jgi:uncharacterized protein YfiM (DUF2279 family)